MCLWCQWSSSWPWKGQCSSQDASTRDSNSTTEVPWIGNLPVTLHTLTLLLHCTPMWAVEERNRIHLEQLPSGSICKSQINGLQGYYTAVIWHLQTSHCPSWHIPKRPRCCPPSIWLPSCLCFQSSYICGAVLCQHRMWTACLCLQSRMILHLCLWSCLHYWEWPQVSWTDQYQESGRYTSLSMENAADSKTMMSPSSINLAKRCWLQMHSLTMHPSRLQRYL